MLFSRLKIFFFLSLQFLLPQHALSRLIGSLADSRIPVLKNTLIHAALKYYNIDMHTAEIKNPEAYPSFNAFFTRHLAVPAASLFPALPQIGSPAEGVVSQIGATHSGKLIQAKGKTYTVQALLAGHSWTPLLQNGSFATLYLAPHNYHRVHIPIDCVLTEIAYVPGRLFSVNLTTSNHIEGLFAKNERMIFYCETPRGKLALVMVGALLVAGIHSPFITWSRSDLNQRQSHVFPKPLPLEAGDELGYFNFGSSVVMVWEEKQTPVCPLNTAASSPPSNQEVTLGEALFQ